MQEILNNYLENFDDFNVLPLDKDLRIVFASYQLKVDLKSIFNAGKDDVLIDKVVTLNKIEFIDKFNLALNGTPQFLNSEDVFAGIKLKFNVLLLPLNIYNERYVFVILKRYTKIFESFLELLLNSLYKLNEFILIDDKELINSNYQQLTLHLCNYFSELLESQYTLFIFQMGDDFIILSYENNILQKQSIDKETFKSLIDDIIIENIQFDNNSIKSLLQKILKPYILDNVKNTIAFLHQHNIKRKNLLLGINHSNYLHNGNYKILKTIFNNYSDLLERKINRILLKQKNYEYEVIKKRYENLFENMLDAFALHKIIVDENNNPIDYEFIDVNPAFYKILNVNKEDIIGKTVLQLWPKTEKYWIENYGKVALTGESIQFENYSSTFNKYFRVHAFSPEIGYFAVIFHDISELVLKHKELEIAKEKAEEKEQLKTDFINNLSHELRTPLNGIIGFLDLINDTDISAEEVKKYFHIINNSSHKLLNIVDNILNISQIQCNQIDTAITSCNLNIILKEILYIYNEMKPTNINLKLNMPLSDEFSEFDCDSYKIKQIIKQLVDNAVKFTLEGEVEFGYKLNGDNVIVFCKDTGIGIDEKDFELIFQPYVQLEKGLTRHYGGNGLGLSIVAEYLKTLNFKYKLISGIGKGTYFEFYIPKINFKHYSKITEINIEDNYKPKILIADDEILNYEYLKIILSKQFNVDILHSINGKIAVDTWNTHKDISLIFMDIKMPVMDGFSATQKLRELGCKAPIIGLTAFATSKTEFLSKEIGFNDILFKPYNKKISFLIQLKNI